MYYFFAEQQTSTSKLPVLFKKVRNKVLLPGVNDTEVACEKAFNVNSFETEDNHKSGDHKKFCFWCF